MKRFTVDEQAATVTHHRTGNINPGDMGDFVRKVEFRDNRLILRSLDTNNLNTWERVSIGSPDAAVSLP